MTDSLNSTAQAYPPASQHGAVGHVVPVPILLGVFLTLIALTGLTVAATWTDLGSWNLLVALGIATVKAALVALYFMHLRYDHPFNGLIFVIALVFLATFLALTLLDSRQAQPDVQKYHDNPPPWVTK